MTDETVGPRNRAPLGNKTTNAKATFFHTPAPPTQEKPSAAKHTSPRLRRAKIKIHEAEPDTADNEAEEREIEFMPPREVPLPDYPDDWPHDRTYPQFEGKNLTRGWWSEFGKQKDDDESEEFSDFEEKLREMEERERKQKAQQAKKALPAKNSGLQMTARDPLTAKPLQTLKSRSAASALSNSNKTSATPSFAVPTAAAKARLPSAVTSTKPGSAISAPDSSRHTAAKVASNSTLGYSKGRAVSATARKPLSELHSKPVPTNESEKSSTQEAPINGRTALDDLFGLQDLNSDDDLGGNGLAGLMEEDEAFKDFQLDPVELCDL